MFSNIVGVEIKLNFPGLKKKKVYKTGTKPYPENHLCDTDICVLKPETLKKIRDEWPAWICTVTILNLKSKYSVKILSDQNIIHPCCTF